MNIKRIENFNIFTEINPNDHKESKLYINNDELIKIIHDSFLSEKRRQNILLLDKIKHPNCVKANYAISNKEDKINGYSMEYLDGYITLAKFITKKNIPFEKRQDIAHNLCQIINDLQDMEYSFVDIHSDNFLIKNDNIKLIDLDSGRFKSFCNDDSYNFRCDFAYNYLADLCLQVLLGTDIDLKNDIDFPKKKLIYNNMSNAQRVFLNHVFDNSIGNFDPIEYLDFFDKNIIDDTKEILKLKRTK